MEKETASWQIYKRNRRSQKSGDMGMDQDRLFEERNRGIDICSKRTNPKNELDKKEHWEPRGIRTMQNVWGKR